MIRITGVLVFILLSCLQLRAQMVNPGGRVQSALDQQALSAATVVLTGRGVSESTITDENGFFQFEEITPGYFQLSISYLGFTSKIISTLEIRKGRENLGTILLEPALTDLEQVIVSAEGYRRNRNVTQIHTITPEEVFRFPGSFYDPARLVSNYAGVINENDQANRNVIRGNGPATMKWFLHDVEIVNPNHTANAGTLSDRPTGSGGGVNILSAQMLENSTFQKGGFTSEYGNVLGGALDMYYRAGDKDRVHFKGQIGLIGIDAALEGPLSKSKESSFLVNYRYSTLGILSAMGVDLGGEEIGFQDLAFNFDFRAGKSELSFFGMGGMSSNIFMSPEDEAERLEFKDQQNIDFDSRMGAIGATLRSGRFNASLVYSGLSHERSSLLRDNTQQLQPFEFDRNNETRLGLHANYQAPINERSGILIGTRLSQISYDLATWISQGDDINFIADGDGTLVQVYAEYENRFTERITGYLGLHVTSFSLTGTGSLEPRANLRIRMSSKSTLGLSYGLHSQVPDAALLNYRFGDEGDNSSLDLMKANHYTISWKQFLNKSSKIVVEAYFQSLYDVPVDITPGSSFSTLNELPYIPFERFDNRGTGYNAGVEMSYSKYFDGNTFYELNGTLYDSRYTASDGVQRNTRWNGNYAVNLIGGKEFSVGKDITKQKSLGLNLRVVAHGGFWDSPIDERQSQELLRTVYDEREAFSVRLPTFYKVDLRIYYKRNRKKYSSIVGLDLLNVTNRRNIAYYYWDPLLMERQGREDLGILPNISYRIEF